MKKTKYKFLLLLSVVFSNNISAAGFFGGIPTSIMKSDFGSLHVVYVELENPIDKGSCDSGNGLVLRDDNESSTVALSLAMTAFAASKRFECYVTNECSRTTGSMETYPVCSYYPRIVK